MLNFILKFCNLKLHSSYSGQTENDLKQTLKQVKNTTEKSNV